MSQSYRAVSREGMLRSGSGVPDLGSRDREIPSPETPTVSGVITQRMPTDGPGHDGNFGIAYQGRPSWRLSGHSTQLPGVILRTRGRAAGEGGHNPTGAVDAATAQYRWSHLPGKPDAGKLACPVWEGVVGKGPSGDTARRPLRRLVAGLRKLRYLAGYLLHPG